MHLFGENRKTRFWRASDRISYLWVWECGNRPLFHKACSEVLLFDLIWYTVIACVYLLRYFSPQAGPPRRSMSPAGPWTGTRGEKTSLTGARLCTLAVIHAVSPACAQKRARVANAEAWERRVMRGSSCHTRRRWSDMAGGGSAETLHVQNTEWTEFTLSTWRVRTEPKAPGFKYPPPVYAGPTCGHL